MVDRDDVVVGGREVVVVESVGGTIGVVVELVELVVTLAMMMGMELVVIGGGAGDDEGDCQGCHS